MSIKGSSTSSKTYILVHGAWHGAWCWNKVVRLLESKGDTAIALDLPGHGNDKTPLETITMDDYVNAIVKVARAQQGSVIILGHSGAGMAISQAAEVLGTKKVSALIYLDAFLPRNGESLFSQVEMVLKQLPPDTGRADMMKAIVSSSDHKTNFINPEMAGYIFYHDCTDEDKKFGLSRLSKEPIAPLATPVQLSDEVYGAILKYYILCTEGKDLDKTVLSTHVACERVFRLASSHSPFFSMPEILVGVIGEC